jgi:hypothetical protein
VISEGAPPRPAPAAKALRLVRNAAIGCALIAVVTAVGGILLGRPGQGGALATGLALGALNGAVAGRLLTLPIPFFATSLLRLMTLTIVGIGLGLAFGLNNIWLVILGLGVAQLVLVSAALRESLRRP